MIEEVTIKFYNISHCGFSKFRQDNIQFGKLKDILNDLSSWVEDEPLGKTCTYNIHTNEEKCGTYCLDVASSPLGEDFILSIWNQIVSTQGKIASVSSKSKVGDASVSLTKLPPDHIPGYATYFWFLPEENKLASIRFKRGVNGHNHLCRYIKSYLKRWSRYAVLNKNHDSVVNNRNIDMLIAGYREKTTEVPENFKAMFTSTPIINEGKIEFIKNRRNDIICIQSRDTFEPNKKIDENYIGNILKIFNLNKGRSLTHNLKSALQIYHTPDQGELNAIIKKWAEDPNQDWEDFGFRFKNESQFHWLSHSLASEKFELNVDRKDGVVGTQSLLKAIHGKRNRLLRILKNE